MKAPPDDAESRRESLEQWVAEQADVGRVANAPEGSGSESTLERVRTHFRLGRGGLRAALAFRVRRFADRALDRGLGTADPTIEPRYHQQDHLPYGPSAWHVLPRALRYVGVSEADTFVDFGSGKGRVLHQAAKHPFRRVVGVEISPELAQAARSLVAANQARYRCRDVEVVVSDAAEFRVPDDMTIAYLYNAFRGETLEAVLRNIVDSLDRNPRLIRLIYVLPDHQESVLATGRFQLVREQRNRFLDTSMSKVSIFEGR